MNCHSEALKEYNDILDCEDTHREQSLRAIDESQKLSRYAQIIDASIAVLSNLSATHKTVDDHAVPLQYLMAQILNSASASLSVLFAGYYQQSALLMRHMLEVGFLLDYLRSNPARVAEWRDFQREGLPPGFKTGKLMSALDKRDKLTVDGRKETYETMCILAAHPTPMSRRMIVSGGFRMVGPFFDARYLENNLGELARNLPFFALVAVAALQDTTPAVKQHCEEFRAKLRSWLGSCYGGFRILRSDDILLTEFATKLWGSPRRRR